MSLAFFVLALIRPFQILARVPWRSDEIEDAAVDGAGELRRFWSIFLLSARHMTVVG